MQGYAYSTDILISYMQGYAYAYSTDWVRLWAEFLILVRFDP
jgi:hypothetical protein